MTKALENGLYRACNLKELNVISDAVIVLKGDTVTTIDEEKNIKLEVQDGD
jgi:hypothetical protein